MRHDSAPEITAAPHDRPPHERDDHATALDYVLRCACGAEEPAPADAVPGQVEHCGACGELMRVELA